MAGNPKILESEKRLSHSVLWDLQQKAYREFGIKAWSQHGVPSYITSNSFTARCYAHVVLGFIRDCLAKKLLDISHPIYLLDLGAGSGRFAYLFLQELLSLFDIDSFSDVKICYVLTDIVESNLTFLQNHALLQPYFQRGILDCAYYHHAQKEPIYLMLHQVKLDASSLVNPLILIANYFFDTIPQDLFRMEHGVLKEGRIELELSQDEKLASPTSSDPFLINHLKYKYTYHPIAAPKTYYAEPYLNASLQEYSKELEGYSFLFPIGALQVLKTFIEWTNSRFLLLAGDQGVCSLEQVRQGGEPKISLHGSFSIAVSYYSLGAFLNGQGGEVLMNSMSDPTFVNMGAILDKDGRKFTETALAFRNHLASFTPVDFWKIVSLTEEKWPSAPLDQLLLLIKLGNWDAMTLYAFFGRIRALLSGATNEQKQQLKQIIDEVSKRFYPISPDNGDFILNLGVLLFEMHYYREALEYFKNSMTITGPKPAAFKNMAACYQMLGDKKAAQEYLQQAIDAVDKR